MVTICGVAPVSRVPYSESYVQCKGLSSFFPLIRGFVSLTPESISSMPNTTSDIVGPGKEIRVNIGIYKKLKKPSFR